MSLSIDIRPKKRFNFRELVTTLRLNLSQWMTAQISGAASREQIEDKAVSADKAEMAGPWFHGVDSGTATAHAVTIDSDATEYEDGMMVFYRVSTDCNGSPITLAITGNNGLFAGDPKPLYFPAGRTPRTAQLRNGGYVLARYTASFEWFYVLSIQHSLDLTRGMHDTGSAANAWAITGEEVGDASYGLWATLAEAEAKLLLVTAQSVNTDAMTLNYVSSGAKAIRTPSDVPIAAGQVTAGMQCLFTYNPDFNSGAGAWVLLSPVNTPATAVLGGASRNLVVKNNATNPNYQVDVTADEIVLKSASGGSQLASAVSKTIDITQNGNANGLDTMPGTPEANSTWYYLWIIGDGTSVAGLISTSATAPTLPNGYTYKALVGVIYNNSGGNFYSTYQCGDSVHRVAQETVQELDNQTGNTSWTSESLTTSVPPIAKTVSGNYGTSTATNGQMAVAGSSSGLGAQIHGCVNTGAGETMNFVDGAPFRDVPLITASTLYWQTGAATAGAFRLEVTGFTW